MLARYFAADKIRLAPRALASGLLAMRSAVGASASLFMPRFLARAARQVLSLPTRGRRRRPSMMRAYAEARLLAPPFAHAVDFRRDGLSLSPKRPRLGAMADAMPMVSCRFLVTTLQSGFTIEEV